MSKIEILTILSVTSDNSLDAGVVYETISRLGLDYVRLGYPAVNVSSHRINEEVVDDSSNLLSYRVHDILCRLGMTETEAHNAIMQIHEAGIKFVKD